MMNTVLLDGLWQGALGAAVAALAMIWIPQRHAATRYAVWFAALLALAILPIAGLWHPSFVTLPAPVEQTAAATTFVTAKAASATGSWLAFVWLAGIAFGVLRLGISYARIDRIVRNAMPAPALGADVMTSDTVLVPIAAGFFSPVVVLPTHLVTSLERGDLESIVQHERAHIRRRDIAGNLIQRIVEACLFFNPWVYVIGRQLIVEREAACDDWAVHATAEPNRYASCLAHLAQSAQHRHTPLLTPSAIGSRRMLVGRIARLLDGKVTQLKINYLVLGTTVAAFGILAVLLQTSAGLAASAPTSIGNDTVAAARCANRGNLAASADVKVLNAIPPAIPKSAFRPNVSANALVIVGADGVPIRVTIVKSSGSIGMDRAIIKAARDSKYSPAMKNCKPITGQYLFHVDTGPM